MLLIKEKEQEKRLKELEKSKPCDEEREICAFIQDCIVKNGGDAQWLGFYKNSSNYVDVSYLYSILKFKCAKKGKYIIVEKLYREQKISVEQFDKMHAEHGGFLSKEIKTIKKLSE